LFLPILSSMISTARTTPRSARIISPSFSARRRTPPSVTELCPLRKDALRASYAIHPSAENGRSANFALTQFCEVRFQRAKSYMDTLSLSGHRETVSPSGVARRWDSLYGSFVARCARPCVRCEKSKPAVRRGRKALGPPSWGGSRAAEQRRGNEAPLSERGGCGCNLTSGWESLCTSS
jgi:hypothetical protein